MAVEVDIWVDHIKEDLFKGLPWLDKVTNGDEFVVGGKIVHIPQAGALPAVERNRTSYPIAVTQRADSDITFVIDEHSTVPVKIDNAESVELSYDKRASVLKDFMKALKKNYDQWMKYDFSPSSASAIIRTTGTANENAHLPAATGTRKRFVKEDLDAAKLILDEQEVDTDERYALVDSRMASQLRKDPDLKLRDNSLELNLKDGVIGRLYGFDIIEIVRPIRYDNTATPVKKDPDTAGAATDNAAVLCFQKEALLRAIGEIKFFEQIGDPTHQADVYSALVRIGGRITRAGEKGVVAIVQEA